MAHLLKFGDRVLWGNEQFVYLHQDIIQLKAGWVISEEGGQYLAAHSALQPVPHPHTVRLDWLLRNAAINIGSEEYYKQKYVSDREAIDAAIRETNHD